jgi:RIO kinase 1
MSEELRVADEEYDEYEEYDDYDDYLEDELNDADMWDNATGGKKGHSQLLTKSYLHNK